MERSFLDYAMSVITARALPDVRDGLKPVQRRILYGMYEQGLRPDRKHQKSAQAVGQVMGKYHPHGARPSTTRSPAWPRTSRSAIRSSTGTGNFGSPDPNDSPAAQRYTEARLAPLAMQLSATSTRTPSTSPTPTTARTRSRSCSRRGSPTCSSTAAEASRSGWRRTSRPTTSTRSSTPRIHLLDNPDAKPNDLMGFVKGPDFPTGGAHPRPRRHQGRVPDRSRLDQDAGRHRDRGGRNAARGGSSSPRCRTRRRSR